MNHLFAGSVMALCIVLSVVAMMFPLPPRFG